MGVGPAALHLFAAPHYLFPAVSPNHLFAFKIKLKCRRHLSQAVFSEEALQASCLVAKCRSGRLVGGKLLAFDSALAARFQCH